MRLVRESNSNDKSTKTGGIRRLATNCCRQCAFLLSSTCNNFTGGSETGVELDAMPSWYIHLIAEHQVLNKYNKILSDHPPTNPWPNLSFIALAVGAVWSWCRAQWWCHHSAKLNKGPINTKVYNSYHLSFTIGCASQLGRGSLSTAHVVVSNLIAR